MKLYELAWSSSVYAAAGARYDQSYVAFQRTIGGGLNLRNSTHLGALCTWLKAWGVHRFFSSANWPALQKSMQSWWLSGPTLPAAGTPLPQVNVGLVQLAFTSLATSVGPVAAAKTLFALRPDVLPPWDRKIMGTLSYQAFLSKTYSEIAVVLNEAALFNLDQAAIPATIGRPNKTLIKLVDEHHYVMKTLKASPPLAADIKAWAAWA